MEMEITGNVGFLEGKMVWPIMTIDDDWQA